MRENPKLRVSVKEDGKENLLQYVFGFRPVVEDLERYGNNLPEIAMEQQCKTFFATAPDMLQQHIVCKSVAMVMGKHPAGELQARFRRGNKTRAHRNILLCSIRQIGSFRQLPPSQLAKLSNLVSLVQD